MRDSNRGVTASSMGYAQNASSSSEPSKSALKTHKTQGKILALPSSNFGSKNNYSMMHSGAKTHRVHSQTRSPTLVRATTSKVISPAATTTSTTDSHAHLHNRSSSSSMLLSHRASHMSSNGSGHSEDDYLLRVAKRKRARKRCFVNVFRSCTVVVKRVEYLLLNQRQAVENPFVVVR